MLSSILAMKTKIHVHVMQVNGVIDAYIFIDINLM